MLTATLASGVSGVTPTGTVTFTDGSNALGTATIASGVGDLYCLRIDDRHALVLSVLCGYVELECGIGVGLGERDRLRDYVQREHSCSHGRRKFDGDPYIYSGRLRLCVQHCADLQRSAGLGNVQFCTCDGDAWDYDHYLCSDGDDDGAVGCGFGTRIAMERNRQDCACMLAVAAADREQAFAGLASAGGVGGRRTRWPERLWRIERRRWFNADRNAGRQLFVGGDCYYECEWPDIEPHYSNHAHGELIVQWSGSMATLELDTALGEDAFLVGVFYFAHLGYGVG